MTIDPDDYDLRELRRIADERRSDDGDDKAASRREPDRSRDHARRTDAPRRNGHAADGRRNGRATAEDDGVTVRPRSGVSDARDGETAADDDVARADRIARDLGFGDGAAAPAPDRRRRGERRGSGGTPRRSTADDVGRFQFDTELRERRLPSRPGEVLRENQLEHLLIHETAASGSLSKPYLTDLPDAYAAERLLFDWLEFLVLKGGFKRTMDALRYYHTVGWLTDDVEADLRDYLVGFSGEVSDTEAYDVADHHLSLVYIARLASMT